MTVIYLIRQLLAGQLNLAGVDNNHKIARIHIRRINGLILAAKPLCNFTGQPAQEFPLCIEDVPVSLDCFFFLPEMYS
jgi:hypothetical protein